MHKLDNSWTLWLHLLYDSDWTINSYKKVYSFDTLENGVVLIENLNKEIVEKCMLFIMKNNTKPICNNLFEKTFYARLMSRTKKRKDTNYS